MKVLGWALGACGSTHGGDTLPPEPEVRLGHPTRGQEAFCRHRQRCCGEEVLQICPCLLFSFQLGRLQALATLPRGWQTAPACPVCSGAALRPGAGWVPGDPSPQPTQPLNATQEPVHRAVRSKPCMAQPFCLSPCMQQLG